MKAEQILSEISKIRWMLPGGITQQTRTNRHGKPVTYSSYNDWRPGFKLTRTSYVLAADVPAMEKLIAEGKRFDNLVARYRELIFSKTRQEQQLPRKPKKKKKKKKKRTVPTPEQPITVTTRRIDVSQNPNPSP